MKKLISLLFVMAFTAVFMVSGAYASDASVTVAVSGDAVVDGTITASFDLAGNPGFAAGSLAVSYDNTKLELVSLTKGLFQGDANKDTGIVNHASVDAVTGDGALCTATFKVLAEGTSSISVTVSGMRDDDGNPFDVAVTAAAVTAVSGGCEHDFSVESKDATGALKTAGNCQTEAVYYKSCSKCGAVSAEDTFLGDKDASVHAGTLGEWQIDDTNHWKEYSCCHVHADEAAHVATGDHAATCENAAVCDVCGEEFGAALGHGDWKNYTVITEANCGAEGMASSECGRCGETVEGIVIPVAGEHSWDEGKVTKEATTSAEGEKTYTCSVCGETKTETIAKLAEPTDTDQSESKPAEPTDTDQSESKPAEPTDTDQSESKPAEPTDTDQSESKPAAPTGANRVESKPSAPKTGDEGHLVVWAALLLVACGGAAVVISRRKKEN